MSNRIPIAQFVTMTEDVQRYMIAQNMAPEGITAPIPQQTAAPAESASATAASTPAQSTSATTAPAGLASLDDVPDQSCNGPEFLPFAEFDLTCELLQVQHRVTERTGPHYFAAFGVLTSDETGMRAGVIPGTTRATMWKYNPNSFGKDKDASNASVARYKTFVRQVCGMPEGAKVDAQSAQLLTDSARYPSLGRKVRIISTRGNERKNKPGTYFYNIVFVPLP